MMEKTSDKAMKIQQFTELAQFLQSLGLQLQNAIETIEGVQELLEGVEDMQEHRLKELAKGLRSLSPKEYNQILVVSSYDRETNRGTICCAIGWTPRFFPDLVEWADLRETFLGPCLKLTDRESPSYYDDIAKQLFGLDTDEVQALFGPPHDGHRNSAREFFGLSNEENMEDEDFTPQYVADDIEEFLRIKKEFPRKNWSSPQFVDGVFLNI